MIIPEQKIRVFISSACGDEPEKQKYNYVREALKVLIESMGFAKTYVFESEGASTISAGQHYTSALEDCDVCIFIIDNKDGVPDGVQKEIDTAKKLNIKSLFYFCDEFDKKETPLQKSLRGAQHAKSTTIHQFKDIIKRGSDDLINDLLTIYRQYCKGRLIFIEESSGVDHGDESGLKLLFYSDTVMKKDLLSNIDYCTQYFSNLILGYSNEKIDNASSLDKIAAEFLPVLFEGADFNEHSMSVLLSEIEKYQTPEHFNVTKKRYEAIEELYLGNQKSCISKLDDALQLAKDGSLSEWLIEDILIDLRNQDYTFNQSKNIYFTESKYQKELTNSRTLLYYPQLDRLSSNYQAGIIEEAIKDKTQSPGTVFLGNSLLKHIKSLAGIYIIAIYNGSLTQLQMIYKRLNYLCFYGASKYSDWSIKKLLLKTSILNGDQKETDGIIQCFADLLSKMDERDAYEIYQFTNNSRIPYRRVISKLDAFRIVAYFLDEKSFCSIWSKIRDLICEWIEDDNAVTIVGDIIFSTLKQTYLRISQDELISIICNCIVNNKRRFYDKVFVLIKECVDFNSASPKLVQQLLMLIINIVKNPDERSGIHTLESSLFTLRKKYRDLTDELDEVISLEMPTFYNGDYLLETTDNENKDLPSFIESNVVEIQKDNIRTANMTAFGKANIPYLTIKNILRYSSVDYSDELIDSVFQVSCETLLCENQDIATKMNAIELLVYLLKSRDGLIERNKEIIFEILTNKEQVLKAQTILTNLNETNLKLSALLLYHCLGEDIIMDLINTLANIGDDTLSNRKASSAFLNYIEANESLLSDIQLEQIILQKSIEWSITSDVTARWNAVQILFLLLRNRKNKDVICNKLVNLIDTDNVYIKTRILRNLHLLEEVDVETYKYIIQKASIDTNYVVRKVVDEITQDSII